MPTVTGYDGKTLTNLGPLTTVFTSASSCATVAPITGVLSARGGIVQGGVFDGCQGIASGCIPQGDKIDEINKVARATPNAGYLIYRSPGILCPAGWTTAGSVIGDGASGTKASGIFTMTEPNEIGKSDKIIPSIIEFATILEKSETLLWCCPSDYTADPNFYCYSTLQSQLSSVALCEIDYPQSDFIVVSVYQGTTLTSPRQVFTNHGGHYSTYTRTFVPLELESSTVALGMPVVALVHKETDLASTGSGGSPGAASSTSGCNTKGEGLRADVGLIAWRAVIMAGLALLVQSILCT